MSRWCFIFFLFFLIACETGLKSNYTGGITQVTLIGSTWEQSNTDFNGSYIRWYFMSNIEVIQAQRGATLYYEWEPYEISGTVKPNPENQAVFKLKSGSPGGYLIQYLLVWFIDSKGTKAVFKFYTTPEDIVRYLVNVNGAVVEVNYQKIQN